MARVSLIYIRQSVNCLSGIRTTCLGNLLIAPNSSFLAGQPSSSSVSKTILYNIKMIATYVKVFMCLKRVSSTVRPFFQWTMSSKTLYTGLLASCLWKSSTWILIYNLILNSFSTKTSTAAEMPYVPPKRSYKLLSVIIPPML